GLGFVTDRRIIKDIMAGHGSSCMFALMSRQHRFDMSQSRADGMKVL
ncbi:MAG: hypothetical protein ACI83E_002939, partial [Sulfitobacter sp.]